MRRRTLLAAVAAVPVAGCTARLDGVQDEVDQSPPSVASRPWILVVPHPDDETLGAAVPLAEKITEGQDVHVLLLTRGGHSAARQHINGGNWSSWCGTIHNPAKEGYAPLDVDSFGKARRDELVAALGYLGGGQLHEAGLIDGQVTVTAAKAAISALVAKVGPNQGVYAPSWLVDDKPDHLAAGRALLELAAEQPTVYVDRRWYVLPPYWSDPRLSRVESFWAYPNSSEINKRARNACSAYRVWDPPHSYAIGYHSVDFIFAAIDSNPRSLLHK